MCIVPRRSAKPAIRFLAREDEVDCFGAGKGVGMVEKVESCQAPVDAVETEVFSVMVFELVFALYKNSSALEQSRNMGSIGDIEQLEMIVRD